MDEKPFQPVDGVSPRWQKLYDLVISRKVGDEVTYGEALAVLGFKHRTDRTLKITQAAMREAQARLERGGERTVGTVPKFGWVVLDASRELQQVDRRLTKTRRAANRVVRGTQALNTRRGELSQFERERLDRLSMAGQAAAQISGRRAATLAEMRKAFDKSTGNEIQEAG